MDKLVLAAKVEQARALLHEVAMELEMAYTVTAPPVFADGPVLRFKTADDYKEPKYKGDVGLLRKALWDNGFLAQAAEGTLFSDKRTGGKRRLKLWFGGAVFNATQPVQERLAADIRRAFGSRLIEMGFNGSEVRGYNGKQFCIWIKE